MIIEDIERLLEQIDKDEKAGGGLLSRETHRRAGEVRVAIFREMKRREALASLTKQVLEERCAAGEGPTKSPAPPA